MGSVFDYTDGDYCYDMGGGMVMDSEGNLMQDMGIGMALDLNSGNLHIMDSSSSSNNLFDDDDNDF